MQEPFERAGSVESVTVMRDQMTGRDREFEFVEMSSDDEAQTAIRELNASQVGGRSLTVNEARPKTERSGGFGGGGGSNRRRSEPRWLRRERVHYRRCPKDAACSLYDGGCTGG